MEILKREQRSCNIVMNKKLPRKSRGTNSFICYLFLILIVLPLFVIFLAERSWVSHHSTRRLRNDFSGSSSRFVDNDSTLVNQGNILRSLDAETESTRISGQFSRGTNRYTILERVEATLAKSRFIIREAAHNRNISLVHEDSDYIPQGLIYRNANAFHRSYLEMEKLFKIYVYEEGEPPFFHYGPCKNIHAIEGQFIAELEKGNIYKTKDPNKALVYFLPFSINMMVKYLYVPGSHGCWQHCFSNHEFLAIGRTVLDYVDLVAHKQRFWNRSQGADHFMLSCDDWAPHTTSYVPLLFNNAIRVLCNANTSEGFNPTKDVSFPEINLKTRQITGLIGGSSRSRRQLLAFFAGSLHGDIRKLILEYWKEQDQDVLVYENVPEGVSYESMMKTAKFCLCPSGYEVASPRVVEAIYAECVPVLISDGYVPPFSDVLNWNAFSVSIPIKGIPNLKKILMSISQTRYRRLHRGVKKVQRHFVLNSPPKRYDVFHMTMHSIWLRRLNILIEDK